MRAFNTIPAERLKNGANRTPDRYAVPLAADDAQALAIAQRLVRDAGFDAVVVGGLARAIEFDTGTRGYGKALTAAELRQALKL